MKVKYSSLNDFVVVDEQCRIMLIKKPKKRYRAIIRAFYKRCGYKQR